MWRKTFKRTNEDTFIRHLFHIILAAISCTVLPYVPKQPDNSQDWSYLLGYITDNPTTAMHLCGDSLSPLTPTSSSALHSACWKQIFYCSAAPAGLNSAQKKLPQVELIPACQQPHQAWYLYLPMDHMTHVLQRVNMNYPLMRLITWLCHPPQLWAAFQWLVFSPTGLNNLISRNSSSSSNWLTKLTASYLWIIKQLHRRHWWRATHLKGVEHPSGEKRTTPTMNPNARCMRRLFFHKIFILFILLWFKINYFK